MIATLLVDLIVFIFPNVVFNLDIPPNNVGNNDSNVGAHNCMMIDIWMI